MENALTTLRRLGWKENDTLYLVLDDTQKQKRAKRMQAVSKIYLHAEKVYATGHTILACAFVYRGVVVPCAVRLWVGKEKCKTLPDPNDVTKKRPFRKLTELAADCIESVKMPSKGRMIVMFDKFYLCDTVAKACENRDFSYIGAAKSNRNFYPDARPNDKRKLSEYGPKILKQKGKWTSVSGAKKTHRLVEKVGTMSKLGRVKLAFSKRTGEKSWLVVVSNNLKYGAKTMIEHYRNRWPIEVMFKMSKQQLGLGDYQFLRYTAVERYLHLVLIAYHLTTHLSMERHGAKELSQGRGVVRLESVEKAQAVLRKKLFEDGVSSITEGSKYAGVGGKLRKLLAPIE